MKKIITIVPVIALLVITIPAFAANTNQETQRQLSPTPDSNTIQNQNQVKTQNEGEESNLQVNTQEQEEQGDDQDTKQGTLSETAQEHMSTVSAKVEELLTTKTIRGGIGEQVKEIAQEQKTAQEQIQTELERVDGRNGLLKSIIGPDFKALKNMQKQMEQNQLRVQELTQLQYQLTNQGDITQVQEMIQMLTDQNTALQDRINFEEQTSSLFGWFFRLLIK